MSGPEVITLGCRLNGVESEAMRALAAGADDLVIVNTCAVTGEAVKQAGQEIRRAARRRPDARILVTGCAAQLEPERFAAMPEVSAVLGNAEKLDRVLLAAQGTAVRVSDIQQVRATIPHPILRGRRARGFVEVQNGCDHRCTFCIIPHARGPSRSVPAGAVVERIAALVEEGCNEVVLTGVDLTSYGPDLPGAPSLGALVERILAGVPALPRLRLSSLDSVEIDDRLLSLIAGEPRLCPHLHLSLQHGDDLILKRMKRRHTAAEAIALVERLKRARPEIAVGADLIAGFPTESEAAAANTLTLLDACDIVHPHVFPYSPRPGTPAARMPALDPSAVRARAARLREAGATRRRRWLETLVGSEERLLIEHAGGRGHLGNFAEARLDDAAPARPAGNGPARGDLVTVRVTGLEGDRLIARTI